MLWFEWRRYGHHSGCDSLSGWIDRRYRKKVGQKQGPTCDRCVSPVDWDRNRPPRMKKARIKFRAFSLYFFESVPFWGVF